MAVQNDGWGDGDSDYFGNSAKPPYENLLFGDTSTLDQHAQDLFIDAYLNKNGESYIELVDYMWNEYGIDWEDVYDWEDFREWYNAQ